MNINEYIEKYSTIDVDRKTGLVTVTMEVPPRKVIVYKHQACDASRRVKIKTDDVQNYLINSGVEILSIQTIDSIDNNIKLNAVWEYKITPVNKKNNNKKNKRREYTEKTISETIKDIS
jgi:hypothetical protein